MKWMYVIFVLLMFSVLFAEETNPIQAYFADPNPMSFQKAWTYCTDSMSKKADQMGTQVLLATLAQAEADRLTDYLSKNQSSFDSGTKFQYANLLFSNHKYEDAIPLYQSLNDSIPEWSCPWRHKGTALFELKRYKEAEASLQKAVETNEEHYDAYIWLAKTQYHLKKYKPALENLEVALKLNPEAESNNDEVLSQDSIRALHEQLQKKNGRK